MRFFVWALGQQVVPRTIAENSGLNATEAVALLHAAHASGQATAGLDIESGQPRDLSADGIVDVYSTKWCASRHCCFRLKQGSMQLTDLLCWLVLRCQGCCPGIFW